MIPGRRTIGVLGGMGPLATVDFLYKLTRLTPAQRDQDHIPVLTCSFPQIPDRTEAILNHGPSPLPQMRAVLSLLEHAGATAIVIPCNTAHYWFDELQADARVPLLHIVDAVASKLSQRGLYGCKLGVLATTGTVQAGVYSRRLKQLGFESLAPPPAEQAVVMDAIRAVKGGAQSSHRRQIESVAANLMAAGARAIVLACTELPLLINAQVDERFIDATAALAEACVRYGTAA